MSEYHDILGVAVDASKGDIKKAYRKLASKHHPDKDGGNEEQFKKIQEAYDHVSHPDKYINEGFGQQQPAGAAGRFWQNVNIHVKNSDDNDFFEGLAETLRRQQQRQHQQIRMHFELSLESTLHEQTHTIHAPEYNIPATEITIPAGIRNGDVIHYDNIPQVGSNYPRLLVVQFVIRPHPDFEVVNHIHLVQYITVDALDAMVGTTLNINTIDGVTLAVKLPAGSENGTKLKIPAKGLKYKDSPNIRGDMYIEINISIPKLTSEEKEIINKLRKKRKS